MDLINKLTSGSDRRAGVFGLTALLVAFNKKLGLDLDTSTIETLAALAIAYLVQSAAKEAHVAGKEAAAKVVTAADAKAVLDATTPPSEAP